MANHQPILYVLVIKFISDSWILLSPVNQTRASLIKGIITPGTVLPKCIFIHDSDFDLY